MDILLIDEDLKISDLIKADIVEGDVSTEISLKSAVNLAEGLNFLRQEHFDIVLLSLSLSGNAGMDSFIIVNSQASYLPVILLAAEDNPELKLSLIKRGAQDYLVKNSLDGKLLLNSILFAIERNKILEPIKQENSRLLSSFKHREDSERRLKQALGNIQDIVIEVDNFNICTFINNAGISFFGSELIGNKMTVFNSETQKLKDKLQTLERNEALSFENWSENKRGEKKLFSWTCKLISSVSGEKEGYLLTAHDVSHSEKNEQAKPEKKHKLLGQLLLERGYINGEQLEIALAEQHKTKILLGEILIRLGYITPEELADVLIMQAELDSENEHD
jgi:PAS domain S-box-containing protein